MPDYVVSKITGALNGKSTIKGSRILVLGIAYKKNVDDVRESPSVYLMGKESSAISVQKWLTAIRSRRKASRSSIACCWRPITTSSTTKRCERSRCF
jgi:UDP-N-acetyl-D-mannosaminuronate dehydrogenase